MPMSTAKANKLGKLLYNNDDYPNVGDAAGIQGSVAAGVYYIRLHTADPGAGGDQDTNEVTYTGYTGGIAVVRTSSGFTVVGANVSNAAVIQFLENTGASQTATHFSIGSDQTGAGNLEDRGLITSPGSGLVIGTNITPKFEIGELDINLV